RIRPASRPDTPGSSRPPPWEPGESSAEEQEDALDVTLAKPLVPTFRFPRHDKRRFDLRRAEDDPEAGFEPLHVLAYELRRLRGRRDAEPPIDHRGVFTEQDAFPEVGRQGQAPRSHESQQRLALTPEPALPHRLVLPFLHQRRVVRGCPLPAGLVMVRVG